MSLHSSSDKGIEKAIAKEAKSEDKHVERVLKELQGLEKSAAKAEKTAAKAEKKLDKDEKKELDALKQVNKATHAHDIAVTNVQAAGKDLKAQKQQEERLQQEIQAKKAMADTVVRDRDAHAKERDNKLNQLHSNDTGPNGQPALNTTGANDAPLPA